MSGTVSRRDFLKASTAAGLATAALNPITTLASPSEKSRVVVATDPTCLNGSKPVKEKIQDMVDYAVKAFTGKTDKGAAYEALFPAPVTATTKIFLKRNDISGPGPINTTACDALKDGFGAMLNGTFPLSNVTVVCKYGSVKQYVDKADYVINCPVSWMHGTGYGVTLSLKNVMPYRGEPRRLHDANKKWLHEESLAPEVKSKQVLTFMDAIVGNNSNGPGTQPNFAAHQIIIGSDLVAVDYVTLRMMAEQPGANSSKVATGDRQLKAAEAAGLGTCTPANIETINIQPPWDTTSVNNVVSQQRVSISATKVRAGVEFHIPQYRDVSHIAVFDMRGKEIWKSNRIQQQTLWNSQSTSAGMYIYKVHFQNGHTFDGKLSIK